ncbi:MAG: toxin-antitoxin system HicB family antitoxin [Acidimicrobiales bacterium]
MAERKVLTVRVGFDEARAAEVAARADGVSVNEFVRQALTSHIEARRGNEAFRRRVAEMIAEDRGILDRLAE